MRPQERSTPAAPIDRTLDRIEVEGRRAYRSSLGLGSDALRADLEARFVARLEHLDLAPDSVEAGELLSRVDAAGLYLATACEAGLDAAWAELTGTYTPRLVGLAVRRGLEPATAADVVDELMGALALPPPRSGTRTRLGTYAGAGSLFGWLAAILVRRIADRLRGRHPTSLDADPHQAAAVPATGGDPACSPEVRESAEGAADALTHAWTGLTPRERLVLALKFRDGLTQRAAARVLGVGEPRVSRLVRQALAKIEAPMRDAVGDVEPSQWPALRDAIRLRLATLAAEVRPPVEGPQTTGERDGS